MSSPGQKLIGVEICKAAKLGRRTEKKKISKLYRLDAHIRGSGRAKLLVQLLRHLYMHSSCHE